MDWIAGAQALLAFLPQPPEPEAELTLTTATNRAVVESLEDETPEKSGLPGIWQSLGKTGQTVALVGTGLILVYGTIRLMSR